MKRSLSLRSEALAELTDGDLGSVVGGRFTNDALTCPGVTGCLGTGDPSNLVSCRACVRPLEAGR